MPIDVIVVDSDDGDKRVPGGRRGCLEIIFLLNDMVDGCNLATANKANVIKTNGKLIRVVINKSL
jgi:hypothetical protein